MGRTGGAEPFARVIQTAFDRPDGDPEPFGNVRLTEFLDVVQDEDRPHVVGQCIKNVP